MTEKDLHDLINGGESSSVEFKEDDIRTEQIAKEIAALLNLQGGNLLLGVGDDGKITGLLGTAKKTEERIMEICANNVNPPVIPHWQTINVDGKNVGIVSLPDNAPDRPYKVKNRTYIRMGTTSREATREQEARLYHASGLTGDYVAKPVINASIQDLEMKRIYDYFTKVRRQPVPNINELEPWKTILHNTELLTGSQEVRSPTIAAILLFGLDPHRLLKNSGVSAATFDGLDKSTPLKETKFIDAPLIPLLDTKGEIIFPGLVEGVLEFVKRNIQMCDDRTEGRRKEHWDYPLKALREAIVNALIHRDYTIPTNVELSLYSNRIEIVSPGRLPNTITIERMKNGCRASRNELLKDFMRDYGYVENMGMGIRYTIIPQMQEHNGTEPELIEEDERFTMILYKGTQ